MSANLRKLHILSIAPSLWSGPGNACIRLAKELKLQGHHLHIAASANGPDFCEWRELAEALAGEGILLHAVNSDVYSDSEISALKEEISQLMVSPGFDLIHAHSGNTALAAQHARRKLAVQTPIVATVHSWNPLRPSLINESDIRAFNQCDLVATVSNSQARLLKAWGLDRPYCRVIPWGTDLAARRIRLHSRALPDPFRIVSMSPVVPHADLRTLIRAFAAFHSQTKRSELIIAGPILDQRHLSDMSHLLVELGIRSAVHFVGQVEDPSLWLQGANIYVSTALSDELCLSLIDAMGYGLPCICTRIEGHTDLAEDGFAMLAFTPENSEELTKRITWTYDEPTVAARLGENARLTASLKYSWRKVTECYTTAYGDILNVTQKAAA